MVEQLLEWAPQPAWLGTVQSCWPAVLVLRVNSHRHPALCFHAFFSLFPFPLVSLRVGLFRSVRYLTKERLYGGKADGCPAPGRGLPYECKTEITSEGDVQSAGHAY